MQMLPQSCTLCCQERMLLDATLRLSHLQVDANDIVYIEGGDGELPVELASSEPGSMLEPGELDMVGEVVREVLDPANFAPTDVAAALTAAMEQAYNSVPPVAGPVVPDLIGEPDSEADPPRQL